LGTIAAGGQTFTVTQAGNSVPVANAGPNRTVGVGTAVAFSGAGSSDSDGTIASYNWTFGDLTSASGVSVSHAYLSAGTYTVNLTVTDNLGATGSGSATVVVTNATVPLTVSLTSPTSGATVSSTITLAASASTSATRVDFYCDSATTPIGTATSTPFTTPCNTTTMPNGSHNFYAKAYDAAGNSTTSAANTVMVNNAVQSVGPWAKSFGGTGTDYGCAVAADTNGNIFVTGYFTGTANFGGADLTSAGGWDVFLAKYSPSGAHLWSKRFGGTGDERPYSIALDASGNIFLGGGLPGGSLMKLSPQGDIQWTAGAGVSVNSVAVDSQGNLIATGYYNGTVPWISPWASYGEDSVLMKFSPIGTLLWAKTFDTTGGSDHGSGVTVDKRINPVTGLPYDNILLSGFIGSGGLDFGGGTMILTGGYLAKFSAAGTHIWSKQCGPGTVRPQVVAVDSNGDVAVSGDFRFQTDFGGGNILGTSGYNMFVAKYSGSDGSYRWARSMLNSYITEPSSITVDAQNNVILAGYFQSTCDFGNQSFSTISLSNYNGFLAKYTSAGAPVWAQSLAGPGNNGFGSVVVDSSDHPIVTGGFSDTASFGGQTLTSIGSTDIVVGRLNP